MTDGSPAFPYPGGRGRLERYEPPLPAVVEDVVLVCAVWVVVEPEELDALARASGCLEAVAWFGGLDLDVAIDDPEEAWRMVAVFQKPPLR